MIHVGCSVEALGTRLDMKFIEIKVINCIDPQNCLINYLDPALLSRYGRVTQNIKLIYLGLLLRKNSLTATAQDRLRQAYHRRVNSFTASVEESTDSVKTRLGNAIARSKASISRKNKLVRSFLTKLELRYHPLTSVSLVVRPG